MPESIYIKSMHPKTEIRPNAAAIGRILDQGWWGQAKIHGHRAQIHISADPTEGVLVYNRQGQFHAKDFPNDMAAELRRLFTPRKGWSAVEGEWLKPQGKLFLFDVLKLDDRVLRDYTYEQRWELLPRVFRSPCITTLPVLKTVDECLHVLADENPLIEGLVFKARGTKGFQDSSIVRCRK